MFGNGTTVRKNDDNRQRYIAETIVRLSSHQRAVVIARLAAIDLTDVFRVVSDVALSVPAERADGLPGEVLSFGRLVE